jgi:IclR family transcriptional regulator, acetate operon repressor
VGLPSLCQDELDRLANTFCESAYLCIRDGLQGLCVAGVESSRAVRFSLSIGARTQLHAGAINEVLLAHSPAWVVEALLAKGLPQLTSKTIVSREVLEHRLAEIRARVSGRLVAKRTKA